MEFRSAERGLRRGHGEFLCLLPQPKEAEIADWMNTDQRRSAWLMVLAAPLVLSACASHEPRAASAADVDRAMTTADQGKSEADKAMQTAQQALQTAQKAEADAQAANQRADKMYERSLHK